MCIYIYTHIIYGCIWINECWTINLKRIAAPPEDCVGALVRNCRPRAFNWFGV